MLYRKGIAQLVVPGIMWLRITCGKVVQDSNLQLNPNQSHQPTLVCFNLRDTEVLCRGIEISETHKHHFCKYSTGRQHVPPESRHHRWPDIFSDSCLQPNES